MDWKKITASFYATALQLAPVLALQQQQKKTHKLKQQQHFSKPVLKKNSHIEGNINTLTTSP
jgi:hypothetical protein